MTTARTRSAKIAAVVTLLAVITLETLANVFVYYNTIIFSNPVSPPLLLGGSNDPDYVTVGLGVNRTNATVNVTVEDTGNYTIGLEYRAGVYWNSFNTDPFESGDVYVKNPSGYCDWSWNPAGYISVTATGNPSSEGGECILLINRTIDASPRAYINYVFRINGGNGYVDTIYYGDPEEYPGRFYTVGVNVSYLFYGLYDASATAWYFNGWDWTFLDTVPLSWIVSGAWYDLTSYRDDSTGELRLESGANNILLRTVDYSLDVKVAGVGVFYLGRGSFSVDFDALLITVGAPPYYVNVTGLQPGWFVRILDNNGNVLANATSSGDTASLEAWRWKFANNATIEVYTDDTMATLVARATFTWVVGGDRYRVSNASVSVFNIFNFTNIDSRYTYNVGLRLVDYNIVSGSFSNISLWVQVAEYTSTRIEIINGTLVTPPITSALPIQPMYTGYAYINVGGDPGSEAVLTVRLYYTIGGVTVEYPVRISVKT